MQLARNVLIWIVVLAAIAIPVVLTAQSPLLAWRRPIYIAAGFAGVIAMGLLLVQPLLAGGLLPGFSGPRARALHRTAGGLLLLLVIVHVGALWITSPPDVIDALTFTSPTPFSAWGVIAMWAVFASGTLAGLWRARRIPPGLWRVGHRGLAAVIVPASVAHALLIEGTMETTSKIAICALVVLATSITLFFRRPWQ